jgi:hypothetical protein
VPQIGALEFEPRIHSGSVEGHPDDEKYKANL